MSLFIPFPSLAEQRAVVLPQQSCDTKIAALDREIALLEELMTGRVAVDGLVEEV